MLFRIIFVSILNQQPIMNQVFSTVDEYIKHFSPSVQSILHELRNIVHQEAPKAQEGIFYAMPGYKLFKKPLVYFAAYDKHIGFYATPTGHSKFEKELAQYKQGKGSVQFPLDKEIPFALIKEIVAFRVLENTTKYGTKT
jgi:uncharacterized protein YdhG (YjbR/CyaY superfamily)